MMAKALAYRRSGIDKLAFLFCHDQTRRCLLTAKTLMLPVKDVLIMSDYNGLDLWKMF